MKKAYIIHLSAVNFSNQGIIDGFKEAGFLVRSINHQDYIRNPSYGVKKLRRKVIEDVQEYKPHIIFVQTQNSTVIDIETFKELSQYGKVVNFTFDVRPFEQIQWMFDAAPFVAMTCFSNQEDLVECKRQHPEVNCMVLSSSCDMEFYRKIETKTQYPEIVFIGNNYEKSFNLDFPKAGARQRMIERLEEAFGERFLAFGLGQKGEYLTPEQELAAYNSVSIVIAQNNYNRVGYTSDRTWRAISSGAFLLQEYWDGMPTEFTAIWANPDELIKNIHFYLAHPEIREDIALRDMEYVRENHSYKNRVMELESALKGNEFASQVEDYLQNHMSGETKYDVLTNTVSGFRDLSSDNERCEGAVTFKNKK